MTSIELLTAAAEARWLEGWTAGPTEAERSGLPTGAAAPDLSWTITPARSGGLSSGPISRRWCCSGAILAAGAGWPSAQGEYRDYRRAGLEPVIVAR
jgi:hypothetical protein